MSALTYTTTTAAEALGLCQSRIRQLCLSGQVGKKHGRDWILSAKDLRFLRESSNRKKIQKSR